MASWVEGEVVNKIQWTERLYSLQVDAPVQPFQAGQFTRLGLDIEGERVGRPYSYVNAPHEDLLEFYFITVPEGPLTNRMVALEPGDDILVQERAAGLFTLKDLPEGRDLWLLSTGTALGVFLSILKTEQPWERFENIVLVHGVRHAEELTYQETIEGLQKAHPDRFSMVPMTSREESEGALPGRITDAVEQGTLEERVQLPIEPELAQVMICGNPDMVRDTMGLLEERGLKRNKRREPGQITIEKYW